MKQINKSNFKFKCEYSKKVIKSDTVSETMTTKKKIMVFKIEKLKIGLIKVFSLLNFELVVNNCLYGTILFIFKYDAPVFQCFSQIFSEVKAKL